jgi:hypothetical protein
MTGEMAIVTARGIDKVTTRIRKCKQISPVTLQLGLQYAVHATVPVSISCQWRIELQELGIPIIRRH